MQVHPFGCTGGQIWGLKPTQQRSSLKLLARANRSPITAPTAANLLTKREERSLVRLVGRSLTNRDHFASALGPET